MSIELRQQHGQDTAAYPYIFTCEIKGCYYTVSAKTKVDAEVQQFKHGIGKNICPNIGHLYFNNKKVVDRNHFKEIIKALSLSKSSNTFATGRE